MDLHESPPACAPGSGHKTKRSPHTPAWRCGCVKLLACAGSPLTLCAPLSTRKPASSLKRLALRSAFVADGSVKTPTEFDQLRRSLLRSSRTDLVRFPEGTDCEVVVLHILCRCRTVHVQVRTGFVLPRASKHVASDFVLGDVSPLLLWSSLSLSLPLSRSLALGLSVDCSLSLSVCSLFTQARSLSLRLSAPPFPSPSRHSGAGFFESVGGG